MFCLFIHPGPMDNETFSGGTSWSFCRPDIRLRECRRVTGLPGTSVPSSSIEGDIAERNEKQSSRRNVISRTGIETPSLMPGKMVREFQLTAPLGKDTARFIGLAWGGRRSVANEARGRATLHASTGMERRANGPAPGGHSGFMRRPAGESFGSSGLRESGLRFSG